MVDPSSSGDGEELRRVKNVSELSTELGDDGRGVSSDMA